MNITIDIENASGDEVPDPSSMRCWITAALNRAHSAEAELCVRIVDVDEMIELNGQYRGKPYPTNVLSFPADLPDEIDIPLLGDIVVCAEVVTREAAEQDKTLSAHWAHMLIHGTLHLLGYDHIDDADAETMEELETSIVVGLGFQAPYIADNQAPMPIRATDND